MSAEIKNITTGYLYVDDVRIAYKELNQDAEITLFFIHGNSCSSKIWANQLFDDTLKNYRLIAIDLPAHGESSEDPKHRYGLQDLGRQLAIAIKQLSRHSPYLLVGLSMGCSILTEMLNHALNPVGIALISPTIVGDQFNLSNIGLPFVDPTPLFSDFAEEDAVRAFYHGSLHQPKEQIINELLEDYKKVQVPFRSVLISKAMEGKISNELELLRTTAKPILLMFGREEKVINPEYLDEANLQKWSDIVYKIPNAGHLVTLDESLEVNKLIERYANEMVKEYLSSLPDKSVLMSS